VDNEGKVTSDGVVTIRKGELRMILVPA